MKLVVRVRRSPKISEQNYILNISKQRCYNKRQRSSGNNLIIKSRTVCLTAKTSPPRIDDSTQNCTTRTEVQGCDSKNSTHDEPCIKCLLCCCHLMGILTLSLISRNTNLNVRSVMYMYISSLLAFNNLERY